MDESLLVDWYDVVNDAANGRVDGHRCPSCREGQLNAKYDGIVVRLRCEACGIGFEGRLAHGRDDAFLREADEMQARIDARRAAATTAQAAETAETVAAPTAAPAATAAASEPVSSPPATQSRPEPWSWQLPARSGGDMDAYSVWADVVESIHNGRPDGLTCPMCSEPLSQITHQRPYIRVRCGVCGEGFEGRLG